MYLNCHSYYSFKYGTMSVESLLEDAETKGITSITLTDINNTSGCLDFIRRASKHNVSPVVGIDFRNGVKQQFVAIASNNEGFYEINSFLSLHLASREKIPSRAPRFNNAYVIYPFGTKNKANELRENEYIGIGPGDITKFIFFDHKNYTDKYVLLHTVTFRNKKDFNAHRLLRAIDNNVLLSKLPPEEQGKGNEVMVPEKELYSMYSQFPKLVENTKQLLKKCSIEFSFKKNKNKKHFRANANEDMQLLKELSYKGMFERYKDPAKEVEERLEKELDLIARQGFSSYFLINWDIITYARHKGFFYVGRGSGANSIIAYCLKITDVDPIELDLYFERFMNEYRENPPDFDIDFSWKDRDAIIEYVFDKYGNKHTSLLGTYNTLQSYAVVRELGKVFGLPKVEIDHLVNNRKYIGKGDQITELIYKYSKYIHDFPTHLSIHAGGILISEDPIHCYTATSLPPKGYPVSQFSMIEAEDLGLYKFDILSQRGLGHIKDAVEIIKKNQNVEVDIRDIPKFKEDEKIKDHLRSGRTMGCFYVESPAMRMLLKKLECDTYPVLVAASSIIRPGVAQSGMMKAYITSFRQPEKCVYIHPKMKELMEETFGIMVYQEDVIKVAHYFAGLSLAEADVLRRGMSGKFRARDEFKKAEYQFIEGCKKKGYADEITKEVWRQVESFAGYSFSKGHSASYAVESYQSMYLKAYYPLEFMVGVINNFGGFYKTEFYVHEARMAGGNIMAPCINRSEHLTSISGKDIYLGFIHMGELEQKTIEMIITERNAAGLFKDLPDFVKRVMISIEQMRLLIRIGAFRFTGRTKKELLWDVLALLGHERKTKPKKGLFEISSKEFQLPELTYKEHEDAIDEIEILGFPLASPFSFLPGSFKTDMKAANLMENVGSVISIIGYYVCMKNTRTIKGEEMMFGTFLDNKGCFFDTVHFPGVAFKYPFRGQGCYLVKGKITEEFNYPSIEVQYMEKLSVLNS